MKVCEMNVSLSNEIKVEASMEGHCVYVDVLQKDTPGWVVQNEDLSLECMLDTRESVPCLVVGVCFVNQLIIKSSSDFSFRLIVGSKKNDEEYQFCYGSMVNAGEREVTYIDI